MRLRFPIPIAVLAGAVGIGAISIAGAQAPTLQPAATDETTFSVALNGANEVPGPGDTDGAGQASVTINPDTGRVCVDLATTNIEPIDAMHIHPGAAGVANPPLVDFAVTSGTSVSKCVTEAAPGDAASIVANPAGFYLNVHTASFAAGAIRGQLAAVQSSVGELRLLDTPVRAYDSRPAASTDGKLVAGTPRVVNLAPAVPAGARGALVTVTVTQTVGVGFVTAYSGALTTAPLTSTVNWRATDSDVATTTTVAVSDSKINVRAGDNVTHVIVDVIGYYL
ncbi:MAG TPA: CHRD domain-containing protein [Acidimicrobiales bacterium]|nr:CHRD domain-containing protein [Acidimicrobiales bacterium]